MALRCVRCQTPAQRGKFCVRCGGKLEEDRSAPPVCGKCGQPLPVAGKFCVHCGSPIAAAVGGAAVVSPPPVPPLPTGPAAGSVHAPVGQQSPVNVPVSPPIRETPKVEPAPGNTPGNAPVSSSAPATKKAVPTNRPDKLETPGKMAVARPSHGRTVRGVIGVMLIIGAIIAGIYFWPRGDKPGGAGGGGNTKTTGQSNKESGTMSQKPIAVTPTLEKQIINAPELARRVDPFDGKTVLFEPTGELKINRQETLADGTRVIFGTIQANSRCAADRPVLVQELHIQVHIDPRGNVLSTRTLGVIDEDDREMARLLDKINTNRVLTPEEEAARKRVLDLFK